MHHAAVHQGFVTALGCAGESLQSLEILKTRGLLFSSKTRHGKVATRQHPVCIRVTFLFPELTCLKSAVYVSTSF